ncbi:sensor domain-containing diguanylate cyclase [Halobacillus sp. Nhm2S1]|uniref:sensor domain-containing diguanylate cyclase n=1 Tax=Halobacillus sp. Nhm2S1 TaxID=2866716 RepID=UPI001C72E645|nr:sensor domain-containing diguanylate cyclase [Halobacillus sp. Nhm2S1]MBX0358065.1 sensor domain-containing diguanylate cyclase [Halobacillus sp. Nhm2S1]
MNAIHSLINQPSLLKNISHHLSDALAIIQKVKGKMIFTYINATMQRVYGDLEGYALGDLYCEAKRQHIEETMKRSENFSGHLAESSDLSPNPFQISYSIQSVEVGETYLLYIKMESARMMKLIEEKERQRIESESRYESVVETSPDSIFLHDEEDRIIYVNQAGMDLLGAEKAVELLGQDIKKFLYNEPCEDVRKRLNTLLSGGYVKGPIERQIQRMDGSIIDVELNGGLVEYHQIKAVQTICRNISERRKQQHQLKEMAYHDQLTNIPNRRYFFEKLEDELKRVKHQDSIFALLFFDLDNFKQINDRYGHQIGDELLVIFTKRLSQGLRKTDTLSRLGGDEFVILLSDLADTVHPRKVADRMLDRVLQPIHLQGCEIEISVSIGVSIYPEHGMDQGELLTKADRALYKAKENGRSCVSVYTYGS